MQDDLLNNYHKVYITSTDKYGTMFAKNENDEIGRMENITDDVISETISMFFNEYGYSVITKENNAVFFQKWSDKDSGRGIAFSLSGDEPRNESLTKLVQIDKTDWYYYEEDES